jgi:two-component system NarL family sensor kinase
VTALALCAVVLAELASVAGGWAVTGMGFVAARDSFMISNAAIGGCCAACGAMIAWHRPANRLGWLLLGAGVAQTATAAITPWFLLGLTTDAPVGVVRWLATGYSVAWPWSVAAFIPLALLHFPDGRLPGGPWPAVAVLALVNAPLQVLLFNADVNPLDSIAGLVTPPDGRSLSLLRIPALDGLLWLQLVSDGVLAAVFAAALVLLVLRFRRGDEQTRRQLLWLLFAVAVAVIVVAVSRLPGKVQDRGFPVLSTLLIALVPIAMTIAVLRHRLLDIRLVWSRTLTYTLLTAAVTIVYLGLVNAADTLLRAESDVGASVLATLVVAAGFNPVRVRLQRGVDRLLYGERADPVRAATTVSARLAHGAHRPVDVLPALCHALRLPYAALTNGPTLLGAHGDPPDRIEVISLRHAGDPVGELSVGVRPGQRRLDPADRAVLELMAVPIGVALRADALSAEVQDSRRAIVTAREEERRQLRRELHDGLGPTLTGIAFQADAVVNLADRDPDQTRELGEDIRATVSIAISEVRELARRLRPVALDELGLVEALQRHAHRLDRRADGSDLRIAVAAPQPLPHLPAAVELAAYRIATEALTNVVRHSRASRAAIELDLGVLDPTGPTLRICVHDDGPPAAEVERGWRPGVGLLSMRERAAELGGTLVAEPTAAGGRVMAHLPLAVRA